MPTASPQVTQDDNAADHGLGGRRPVPAVDAFKKANPDVKINVGHYDGSANGSNSFKTKIELFDRPAAAGRTSCSRPRTTTPRGRARGSNGKQAFAAVLDSGLVPKATLDNFTPGSLDPCTVDGKVYCLRNDLAQVVLWYNKTLLDQFGYSVPTTWEEYQALGEKVATEHPGYIIGAVGDTWTPEVYIWGSKCQANDITGPTSVTVNTTSTRVQAHGVAAGHPHQERHHARTSASSRPSS